MNRLLEMFSRNYRRSLFSDYIRELEDLRDYMDKRAKDRSITVYNRSLAMARRDAYTNAIVIAQVKVDGS